MLLFLYIFQDFLLLHQNIFWVFFAINNATVSVIQQMHYHPHGVGVGCEVGCNETGPQTNGQPLEKKMKRIEQEAEEHTPAS